MPWCLALGVLVTSAADATQSPVEERLAPPRLLDGGSFRIRPLNLIERSIRPVTGIAMQGPLRPVGARVPAELAFSRDPAFLPPAMLYDMGEPVPGPAAGRRFQQVSRDGTTGRAAHGAGSPRSRGSATSPLAVPVLTAEHPEGSTPSLPRAVVLASTTPAPIEPEVIAMPRGMGALPGLEPPEGAHPNYAELIEPEEMTREQRCLAEAVYFEARSEPLEGQAAVAQVVLNRVKSGLYPKSVCGVVYQNRNRYKACQFSFACEGKSLRITEPGPWKQAVRIALDVTEGKTYNAKVGDALNYHADYVRPSWARFLHRNDTIGRHIFYSLRTSQK